MIAAGELGEIRGYRGLHAEDYMADADGPYTFRHDPAGGGALADLGSHALATAEFLLGPIVMVMGDCVLMAKADAVLLRLTTSDGRSCGSKTVPADRSKATGSPPDARCNTTLRSMDQRGRSALVSKGSTSCTFIQPKMRPAAEASAGSRPHQIIHLTGISVWLQAIRLGLTTLKPSKLLDMYVRLPEKGQSRFHSERGCEFNISLRAFKLPRFPQAGSTFDRRNMITGTTPNDPNVAT